MPIFGEAAGVVSIARIEGAHSDRAASASTEATPAVSPSEALPMDFPYFALRESPDCPSLRASNEHLPSVRVLRARRMVQRLPIPFQARSLSLQGWGLIDLLLRASSHFPISFSRVTWSILDCARRTSTF
jgi:hypothetical protein